MKPNQQTYRTILLLAVAVVALSTFPRINRTKLQHTYVDHLKQNLCSKPAAFDRAQIDAFRESRTENTLIEFSIEKAIAGDILGSLSLTGTFFLKVLVYSLSFVALCVCLRRLSKYNSSAVKSGVKMSEELNAKGNNRKSLLFKALVLSLLLFNTYNAIVGLRIAGEVQTGLEKLLCNFVNIPNDFARPNGGPSALSGYTSFNDYQYEVMSLRLLFKESRNNLTYVQKYVESTPFLSQTQQFSTLFVKAQHKNLFQSVSNTLGLVGKLKDYTTLMGKSLNHIRQLLYSMKVAVIFGQAFFNSYFPIEQLSSFASQLTAQTYQIILFCSFAVFLTIIFMNAINTPKPGEITKYIILAISLCSFLCLSFSSLGSFILPAPNVLCSLLAENSKTGEGFTNKLIPIFYQDQLLRSDLLQLLKSVKHQSDGNMAFTNPQVYPNMQKLQKQFKILSGYNLKGFEKKLVLQQPKMEKEIHTYFQQLTILLAKIKEISLIFDNIFASVSKEGNFGRLTLRPVGTYLEDFECTLCDVNLGIWSKNTRNLLVCGVTFILIMVCLAMYLSNKLKGDYRPPSQKDTVELGELHAAKSSDS